MDLSRPIFKAKEKQGSKKKKKKKKKKNTQKKKNWNNGSKLVFSHINVEKLHQTFFSDL